MTLFSVREAAAKLCLSESTVYGLCKRRRLRHERHGLGRGTIRIPEDALQEYRARVTVGVKEGTPPPPRPRVKLKNLSL
jgi:excisionase family DNA binding protein